MIFLFDSIGIFYLIQENPWYSLNSKLGGSQNWSANGGKVKVTATAWYQTPDPPVFSKAFCRLVNGTVRRPYLSLEKFVLKRVCVFFL
jgi:hypothetical protein